MAPNARDTPPSYDSMFGELTQKKDESEGFADFTKQATDVVNKRTSGLCGMIVCGIFCSLAGVALPVTEIVIGSLYLNDCSAQRLIPIYLIVSGVFGLLGGSFGGASRCMSRKKPDEDVEAEDGETPGGSKTKASGCCGSLVNLFTFVWFICGTVWVFRMTECDAAALPTLGYANSTEECFTKDTGYSASGSYCHRLLYDFTYYETIVKWALYATVIFFLILFCCCCCCAFCCSGSKKGARQNNQGTELAGGGQGNAGYNAAV